MRTRFGYGKPKVRIVKDATPIARMNAIWEGLEEGELSAQEATQLSSVNTAHANILASQSPESEEFKRDTREELMEKIYAMQKVIDYSKGK
jgi:predicted secreted protein